MFLIQEPYSTPMAVNILSREDLLRVCLAVVIRLYHKARLPFRAYRPLLALNSASVMTEFLRGGGSKVILKIPERTVFQMMQQIQYNTYSWTATANYSSSSTTSLPDSFIEILRKSTVIIDAPDLVDEENLFEGK